VIFNSSKKIFLSVEDLKKIKKNDDFYNFCYLITLKNENIFT